VYYGLKRLVLVPTVLLVLFLGLTFYFMPKIVEKAGKLALSAIVLGVYTVFMLCTIAIVKVWGANAQEKRYKNRENDFNKILQYFNKKVFQSKGISLESGRYGAYIVLNLVPVKSTLG
jgi:hypothetical protein